MFLFHYMTKPGFLQQKPGIFSNYPSERALWGAVTVAAYSV